MEAGGCPVSARAARMPPFLVMEVLERAQALGINAIRGCSIIDVGVDPSSL